MTDRILKKKYYKIEFTLASPLALGSGENDTTDKDLIRDAQGKPYIPASSVAGVIREHMEKNEQEKRRAKQYLGGVDKNKGDGNSGQSESKVIFYDATPISNDYHVTVRDSVALDEYKTAMDGAKFDMEVLEPGARFRTYIEQSFTEENNEDYGAEIAEIFIAAELVFGGKSTRGYGAIEDVSIGYREFDMAKLSDEVDGWLSFDIFSEEKWDDFVAGKDNAGKKSKRIRLMLAQRGGISIRKYTTRVSSKDKPEPDMEQLTVDINGEQIPVIPGTSWAGAIRHRMEEFGIETEGKESIFGFVKGNGSDSKARSRIRFGESQIRGGNFKTISRNAIDRFSGGTVDGALFTERTYYGGKTELDISWESDEPMPDKEQGALAAALTDLHYGFLAVGGETSIGRGLFSVMSICGDPIPDATAENSEKIYQAMLDKIREVFG